MKTVLTLTFLLTLSKTFSQSTLEWRSEYQLILADFQSPQTEIDSNLTTYAIYSGSNVDFSYQMSSYELMFTKNFNSKVKATFNRKAAVISAPDSIVANQMVKFGQYTFDLAELFARKFRKKIYEEKGSFSDASFFLKIFDVLQDEMNAENARVSKLTDLGRKEELLMQEQQQIISEINGLSDFCLECKPPKKKKE